jgi:hypothetical protein
MLNIRTRDATHHLSNIQYPTTLILDHEPLLVQWGTQRPAPPSSSSPAFASVPTSCRAVSRVAGPFCLGNVAAPFSDAAPTYPWSDDSRPQVADRRATSNMASMSVRQLLAVQCVKAELRK